MRWQLNSLRSRIVLLTAVLFALVQALAYFFVSSAHEDNARVAVAHQLSVGGRLLERLVEDRARQLQREAESLIEHSMALQRLNDEAPGLEQAIAKASLSQGLDLSMLLGVDGRVIKDFSGAFARGSDFPLPGLLSEAARLGRGYAVARLASRAFVVAAVPVGEGAGGVGGPRARWFLAGLRIDQVMASDLKQLSGLDVSIVEARRGRDVRVLATTLPEKLRGALIKQFGVGASAWGQSKVLTLQSKSFETRQFALTTDGTVVVTAVLQRSLEDVLVASRRLRWLLLVLACISIPASVWVGVWIARSITRPLHALTKAAVRIQQGQYDQVIEVESADELAVLADSLNHMRTGIASREAEIMRLAYEDPLTGLPNRARLMQRLRAILDGQAGGARHGMVLYLNLDRFQVINDTLGHAAGDAVLREVAHRLEQVVAHVVGGVLAATGTEGFIARAEGDEFVVVLPGATSAIAAETVREIASALRPAIEVSGQPVDAGASIGVSAYPADATEAGALIQKASIAMVQAKRNNQLYAYYEPGADVARREQLSLLGELRNAVQHSELRACYQPKIDLQTQRISGVEALVRWRHPKRGLTLPALFMPYAEKTGFVRVITRWMLAITMRQCGRWAASERPLNVAVNLSARDLMSVELPQLVYDLLHKFDVPHKLVTLEITESSVMEDPERALSVLQELHRMGVRLSIDDFGTGFSSLAYLKKLPVDEIKIDRTFVHRMIDDADDRVIVRSTIELAHSLGLKVVAEGVESEQCLDVLRSMGCDIAQGYYFSPGMRRVELERWLQTSCWGYAVKKPQAEKV